MIGSEETYTIRAKYEVESWSDAFNGPIKQTVASITPEAEELLRGYEYESKQQLHFQTITFGRISASDLGLVVKALLTTKVSQVSIWLGESHAPERKSCRVQK